jgi:ATP-dependent Clp protease, protease subunit
MSKTGELLIYDSIGESFFGGISAKSFIESLSNLGEIDELTVRINSPGGNVFDAAAIYNAIKRHPARTIIEIDGVAASAASYIAMAGDEVRIAENARFMIHNAMALTMGNRHAHSKRQAILSKLDQGIASLYAKRSKQKLESVAQMMDDETWFTAAEAVAAGFAEKLSEAQAVKSKADPRAFGEFKNAPDLSEFLAQSEPDADFHALCDRLFADDREAELVVANFVSDLSTGGPDMSQEKPAESTPTENQEKPTSQAPVNSISQAQLDEAKEAARREGIKLEADRQSKIQALCATAGVPDAAIKMCADPTMSVEQCREHLFTLLCKKNRLEGDTGSEEPGEKADPDKEIKAAYAEGKAVYEREGISEADFVASMKITAGGGYLPMPKRQPAKPAA